MEKGGGYGASWKGMPMKKRKKCRARLLAALLAFTLAAPHFVTAPAYAWNALPVDEMEAAAGKTEIADGTEEPADMTAEESAEEKEPAEEKKAENPNLKEPGEKMEGESSGEGKETEGENSGQGEETTGKSSGEGEETEENPEEGSSGENGSGEDGSQEPPVEEISVIGEGDFIRFGFDKEAYLPGDTVSVVLTPDAGYDLKLESILVMDGEETEVEYQTAGLEEDGAVTLTFLAARQICS